MRDYNVRLSVIIVTAILSLISCSKNSSEIVFEQESQQNYTIPISAAIDNLEETIDAISFHTKADERPKYNNSGVIVLGKNNLAINTKGGEGIEIPDTLLYIVNFNDDEGFAVLAADNRIPMPVLCITESGSLQGKDFEEAIQKMQNDTKAEVAGFSEMGESFVPALLLSSVLSKLDENKDGGNRDGEGGGGGEGGGEGNGIDFDSDFPFLPEYEELGGVFPSCTYGPYVLTKWGQSVDPFNRYTPNHNPAGCACIALAQFLVANEASDTMVFNGVTCNWSDMAGVYNYTNYQSNNTGSESEKEQVANFIYGLGSEYLDMCYTAIGSYPNTNQDYGQILIGALESLGYSTFDYYNHNSFTMDMCLLTHCVLAAGYPVIILGYYTSNGPTGHYWIIDGYTKSALSQNKYFHINWGWRGQRDGYYEAGVFNTACGVSASYYDDQQLLHYGPSYNFSWDFVMIAGVY